MIVEIRCCCNAGKLLGTVDVPESQVVDGRYVPFLLSVNFDPRRLQENARISGKEIAGLRLPVARFWDADLQLSRIAIKSMDTPIELLRRIPSFRAVA